MAVSELDSIQTENRYVSTFILKDETSFTQQFAKTRTGKRIGRGQPRFYYGP